MVNKFNNLILWNLPGNISERIINLSKLWLPPDKETNENNQQTCMSILILSYFVVFFSAFLLVLVFTGTWYIQSFIHLILLCNLNGFFRGYEWIDLRLDCYITFLFFYIDTFFSFSFCLLKYVIIFLVLHSFCILAYIWQL